MVYGITPQESPADTDSESKRRETPIMDQTIIERKSKREQTSPIQEVLTKPLTQFTQNILGSSVITAKPKMTQTTQTKTTSNQEPIQPDFYFPDERGSRLSEVHQIKTGEKSPKGNPSVLLVLENLRSKYGTKFFLLDQYSGHWYIAGNETIGPNPIEEKGWIYPTESSLTVAGALSEFQQTPCRSMQVSNIKETPGAESTLVPMAISTAKMEGRPMIGNVDESPLEVDPTREKEEEQWDFIWDEVKKMKEAQENAQKEQQRLRKEQVMIEEQWTMIEAERKQRLQEQWEKTQDSILRAK